MALKMAARKNTLKDLLVTGSMKIDENNMQMHEYDPADTPPHSDVSFSPEHSLPSSPEYQTEIKNDSDDEPMGITRGMLDHSKMALCMFMLAVISFNPFGFALNKITGVAQDYSGNRRSLLSGESIISMLSLLVLLLVVF